jgi:hypothetical protein
MGLQHRIAVAPHVLGLGLGWLLEWSVYRCLSGSAVKCIVSGHNMHPKIEADWRIAYYKLPLLIFLFKLALRTKASEICYKNDFALEKNIYSRLLLFWSVNWSTLTI